MSQQLQLLHLPNELIELILFLICLENARDIQACRMTCRTLNAAITRSGGVRYLLRATLLGVYDPLVEDASAPTVSERMAELCAWDDAWRGIGDILRQREPDARIVPPVVNILDKSGIPTHPWQVYKYVVGPRFIVAVRKDFMSRPGYSYLDVHECLGPDPADDGSRQSRGNEDGEKRWSWTTIEVPLLDMHVSVVSPEVDLAVALTMRLESFSSMVSEVGGQVEVHLLRFRDGIPHPCAKVPIIHFSNTHASAADTVRARVFGDYLLLWFCRMYDEDASVRMLHLIAWKEGSVTLLRENRAGGYGSVPTMISDDVFMFIQLNPPGIELCQILNMKGTTSSSGSVPHMEKLCTLLLPPLRDNAYAVWATCNGEHPGHEAFSHEPLPEYPPASPRPSRWFRLSMQDSVISVALRIRCRDWGFTARCCEVVVRRATLLTHVRAAEALPSSDRGRVVPWAEWGPRTTSVADSGDIEWVDLLGERSATINDRDDQICITDYNPYRVRQAAVASSHRVVQTKPHHDGEQTGDFGTHEDGHDDMYHQKGGYNGRFTETSTISAGVIFQDDVLTALPHVDVTATVPGCEAIYMQQDQLLLRVRMAQTFPTGHAAHPMEQLLLYRL